jgi:hypothetical protein
MRQRSVASLPLHQDNHWIDGPVIPPQPHDAGIDSGVTWRSSNQDTDPRYPIAELDGPPFSEDGTVPRMGTFTFTRMA